MTDKEKIECLSDSLYFCLGYFDSSSESEDLVVNQIIETLKLTGKWQPIVRLGKGTNENRN